MEQYTKNERGILAVGLIGLAGIIIGAFFMANRFLVTGNSISALDQANSSFLGIILVLIGIVLCLIYIKKRFF